MKEKSENPHVVIPITIDFTVTPEKLQKLFSHRVTSTSTNDESVSANLAALNSFGGLENWQNYCIRILASDYQRT